MIVDQRFEHLALVVAKGADGGGVHIAPGVEEVAVVVAEQGGAPSGLGGKTFALAILMGHPHLLLGGSVFVRGIVGVARLFVIAIDGTHL